jgi:soluble lytic murein transglycosylase-like protein
MSFIGYAALVSRNSTSSLAPAQATQPTSVSKPVAPAAVDVPDERRPTYRDLRSIIAAASASNQIDADFIVSVLRAESGNNPCAQWLMQPMPQTAGNLGVSDRCAEHVDAVVRYLRELLLQYNGDAAKALAAYHAGPQLVQQYGMPGCAT